jgi:flagellin-like hook-associated protein FlgL
MDSLENNNVHGIRIAIDNLDYALDHTEENISYTGTFNSKIETLTAEKEDKGYTLNTVVSKMVSADITELATEYTMLQTMYQALLYSIAKMQNLNLLNYL